jgi:hypothetical protein
MHKDDITKMLRDSIGAVLREKHGKGKVMVPTGTLDAVIDELARNAAAPLIMELADAEQTALENRLELESLHTRLTQAGGTGATLDIMLTNVLENARDAFRARDELQRLKNKEQG